MQEAQAASALNHPHIVTIHEIESAGDRDFIVMEYVRGQQPRLGDPPRQGMRLGELLRIAIPVADALGAAHARGIVHRDLKPANVMIGGDGAVKVLDFGLAKRIGREERPGRAHVHARRRKPALESAGDDRGDAAYMAPEQATGGTVDARSDIFSFGAMLYEMVTVRARLGQDRRRYAGRRHPRAADAADAKPSGLPRELERLILRCLRKEPDRRYQTIRDVSLELQEIKEESDSGRLSATVPAGDAHRRSRLMPAVIVAAAVVVAAIAIAWWLKQRAEFDRPGQRLTSLDGTQRPGVSAGLLTGRRPGGVRVERRETGQRGHLPQTGRVERTAAPHDGCLAGRRARLVAGWPRNRVRPARAGQDHGACGVPDHGAERKISDPGAGSLAGPVLVTRRSMAGNRPWHPVECRQPPAGPRPGRRAANADHDEGLHRLSFVLAGRAGSRVQDVRRSNPLFPGRARPRRGVHASRRGAHGGAGAQSV